MNILKRILVFIAVGAVPLILAGCYGVPMQDRTSAEEDPACTTEPVSDLETEETEATPSDATDAP